MNVHATDWTAHYRNVRHRLAQAAIPARIRLAQSRYNEPIGPESPLEIVVPASFRKIRDEELAKAGVTLAQFMGDCRMHNVTATRRAIWDRASKETKLSISHIGRLSGKDHTTILVALRRAVEIETGISDDRLEKNRVRSNQYWQARKARRSPAAAIVEG